MATKGRWATVTLGQAILSALLVGCPSLGDIGVGGGGGGDAGAERSVDAAVDAPQDDAEADSPQDAPECKADIASDPKNCGRCRHDCMGGACDGGVCQPYAIVSGNQGPYGVATHAGVVFFSSTDNTISRCTADSCADTLTQMTSGQGFPRRLTTDDTNVYWANEGYVFGDGGLSGSIGTCGLLGCPGGLATLLAAPENGPVDIAVSADKLYWTTQIGRLVRDCPISGCGDMAMTLASPAQNVSGVAVDEVNVYWAEPMAGNVMECPLGGCKTLTPFATGQGGPMQVIVVGEIDGTLYWSNHDEGTIMRCDTSSAPCSPKVFASGQAGAFALAHDAKNLYWTLDSLAGQVLSCPLAGCVTPVVLGDMQKNPTAIAVDDTAVYWTNYGGGSVMRVMK
jgi:hypothetical protein